MRIDPNRELSRTPETTLAKTVMTRCDETESTPLPHAAQLTHGMKEMPVVRPEKVAQAKARVKTPGYPGEKTLEEVAGLLADHLKSKPGD